MLCKIALIACLATTAMALNQAENEYMDISQDLARTFNFNVSQVSVPILGGLAALLIGILIAASVYYGRGVPAEETGYGYGQKYSQAYDQQYYGENNFYARRGDHEVNDFASLMFSLENAFKKWEISEVECKMFEACQAAIVEEHSKNGPTAKSLYDIISAIKTKKQLDTVKLRPEHKAIIDSFDYGRDSADFGTPEPCQELRVKCAEVKQN